MRAKKHNLDNVCPTDKVVDNSVDVYAMFNDIKENIPQAEYVLETPKPIKSINSLNVMGTKCVRNRVAKIDNTTRFIKSSIKPINKRGQVHVGVKPKAYSKDSRGINVALTNTQWLMVNSIDIEAHIKAEGIKASSNSVKDTMLYFLDKINGATINKHQDEGHADDGVMISHQYMQCMRREHKITELAIRLCVAHGLVIEDSEYGFNNGSIDNNTTSKCRVYKIASTIEQDVVETLLNNKVCYGHIFPHQKPTKVDGKWGKRGKAINKTSTQQESNKGHQNVEGPIDNTVGKNSLSIDKVCYVEVTSKERKEMYRGACAYVYVCNQNHKNRLNQWTFNKNYQANKLIERQATARANGYTIPTQ